jgi:hypothetical protein
MRVVIFDNFNIWLFLMKFKFLPVLSLLLLTTCEEYLAYGFKSHRLQNEISENKYQQGDRPFKHSDISKVCIVPSGLDVSKHSLSRKDPLHFYGMTAIIETRNDGREDIYTIQDELFYLRTAEVLCSESPADLAFTGVQYSRLILERVN